MSFLDVDPADLDLLLMPPTYRCGAFTCGNEIMDEALRKDLPLAISERRTKGYYLEHYGVCVGFFSIRAERIKLDVLDVQEGGIVTSDRRVPVVLLETLGVNVKYRRQGIGTRLAEDALVRTEEVAQRIGVRFLVADSTKEAIPMYEHLGFLPTEKQRHDVTTRMIIEINGDLQE